MTLPDPLRDTAEFTLSNHRLVWTAAVAAEKDVKGRKGWKKTITRLYFFTNFYDKSFIHPLPSPHFLLKFYLSHIIFILSPTNMASTCTLKRWAEKKVKYLNWMLWQKIYNNGKIVVLDRLKFAHCKKNEWKNNKEKMFFIEIFCFFFLLFFNYRMCFYKVFMNFWYFKAEIVKIKLLRNFNKISHFIKVIK